MQRLVLVLCACASIGLATSAHAQFTGSGELKTLERVSDILLRPVVDQPVLLRGRIVRELSSRLYQFTDGASEIPVAITESMFAGETISDESMVEIAGKVRKDFRSAPFVVADRFRVLSR